MTDLRERLKGEVSPEIIQYLFAPAIEWDGRNIFDDMLDVDIVHVLMLARTGILPEETARILVRALSSMKNEGFPSLRADPSIEDLHYNVEKTLIDRLGIDVGGRMHTARSRNDLGVTCNKMWLRKKCMKTMKFLNDLRNEFLRLAVEHHDTVMTIYTHSQPAQPVTLGYYFAAAASVLERDFQRLKNAFALINKCPLGAGAIAGTAFPIDRDFTSDLLGFDGVVKNAIDAIASRDYVIDVISAVANMMTSMSRFAQDLYLWSTYEFNLLEVDNSVAGTSSIMPQKKNPITLEHIKGKAAHSCAALVSVLSVLKGSPFSHTRDVSQESFHLVKDCFLEAESALILFKTTLNGLKVKKDVMLRKSKENFSAMTELADTLVLDFKISFREAHQITGVLVSRLMEKNLSAEDITPKMVEEVSQELFRTKLRLSPERLAQVLDPESIVKGHHGDGSVTPYEVKNAANYLRRTLEDDSAILLNLKAKLDAAGKKMTDDVEAFLKKDQKQDTI